MTPLTLALHPHAPYDFNKSASIFSHGDREIRIYESGIFSTVLDVSGTICRVIVHSNGNVDDPELKGEFQTGQGLTVNEEEARRLIWTVINGDLNLLEFYGTVSGDPVMASFVKQLNGVRNFLTPTVFEALVESIIEQQISLVAAMSMQKTLIRTFGPRLVLGKQTFYAFPGPEILAAASLESLRECGLSSRKGEYIRDLASNIVGGEIDIEGMRTIRDHDPIIGELLAIRGVGPWTAELTALRGLGIYSAFPADDLGLRRIIAGYYCPGQRIGPEDARKIASRWGEWKGLAGYYLVVAGILGIKP